MFCVSAPISMTTASSRPLIRVLETIVCTVPNDPAAGGAWKVRRKDQRAAAIAAEKIQPRPPCNMRVDTEVGAPLRISELQRRVHQIRAENGFLPPIANPDGELTRRMTGDRLDTDTFRKAESIVDQLGLPRFHDRQHAVGYKVTCPTQAPNSRL